MMSDFHSPPSRKNTGSVKWDKYKDTDILPMWIADMDFPVADAVQKALEQRIKHPLYGYTTTTDKTAEVVCKMLKDEFDWIIDPSWLVWIPGVVPGLWAACVAYGPSGNEALFNTPIYHHFFHVPAKAGKVAKAVPLKREVTGRWTYDFAALEAAISNKSSLMLLCSPHNPTGTLFTEEETRKMCELCDQHNLTIVSDEIHCGLILDKEKRHIPSAIASPESQNNLITLMSPSKTFNLAGLNCSFAIISNPQKRKQFSAACASVLPMIPTLAYTVLEAAYSEGGGWHQQMLKQLRVNYTYLVKEIGQMKGLEMSPMQATYLAWINTDGLLIDNAAELFEKFGVGLSAGAGFGLDNYVRLNFACPLSTLQEVVDRMRKAIASL